MQKKVIFDGNQVKNGQKQGLSMYPQSGQQTGYTPVKQKSIDEIIPPAEKEQLIKEARKEAYKKHVEKLVEEKLGDPDKKALKQAKDEVEKEIKNNERKLDVLVKKSNRVLLNVKSVFPF